MTFLGINANKILNKIHSFGNWLIEKDPTVFTLQEEKRFIHRTNTICEYKKISVI